MKVIGLSLQLILVFTLNSCLLLPSVDGPNSDSKDSTGESNEAGAPLDEQKVEALRLNSSNRYDPLDAEVAKEGALLTMPSGDELRIVSVQDLEFSSMVQRMRTLIEPEEVINDYSQLLPMHRHTRGWPKEYTLRDDQAREYRQSSSSYKDCAFFEVSRLIQASEQEKASVGFQHEGDVVAEKMLYVTASSDSSEKCAQDVSKHLSADKKIAPLSNYTIGQDSGENSMEKAQDFLNVLSLQEITLENDDVVFRTEVIADLRNSPVQQLFYLVSYIQPSAKLTQKQFYEHEVAYDSDLKILLSETFAIAEENPFNYSRKDGTYPDKKQQAVPRSQEIASQAQSSQQYDVTADEAIRALEELASSPDTFVVREQNSFPLFSTQMQQGHVLMTDQGLQKGIQMARQVLSEAKFWPLKTSEQIYLVYQLDLDNSAPFSSRKRFFEQVAWNCEQGGIVLDDRMLSETQKLMFKLDSLESKGPTKVRFRNPDPELVKLIAKTDKIDQSIPILHFGRQYSHLSSKLGAVRSQPAYLNGEEMTRAKAYEYFDEAHEPKLLGQVICVKEIQAL